MRRYRKLLFEADMAKNKKKSSLEKSKEFKKSHERSAMSNEKLRKRINS